MADVEVSGLIYGLKKKKNRRRQKVAAVIILVTAIIMLAAIALTLFGWELVETS